MLGVCKGFAMVNVKQKLINDAIEERDLNPREIIYLNITSHKKLSYGGSNNWILLQESDIKQI